MASSSIGRNEEEDEETEEEDPPQDLSSMVKVEVEEGPLELNINANARKSPLAEAKTNHQRRSLNVAFTPSPPRSSPPQGQGFHHRMLPQLTPMPPPPPLTIPPIPQEPLASSSGKEANNMFHFGDVIVSNHPDAPPVPMVIPMVYLYPLVNQEHGKEITMVFIRGHT